ncbi:hypothetical protein Ocin01_06148 [Orchesella cincta]|uniref:Uncharacterized protein n=1 Tax=Orchesella cincta TaxID=48709 RepID=A0A1D2N5K3_ORCCI|nr:hypothetical protein Ocin01_06148 [Orchesella cincta]
MQAVAIAVLAFAVAVSAGGITGYSTGNYVQHAHAVAHTPVALMPHHMPLPSQSSVNKLSLLQSSVNKLRPQFRQQVVAAPVLRQQVVAAPVAVAHAPVGISHGYGAVGGLTGVGYAGNLGGLGYASNIGGLGYASNIGGLGYAGTGLLG